MNTLAISAHANQILVEPLNGACDLTINRGAVLNHIMIIEDVQNFDLTVNILENAHYQLNLISLTASPSVNQIKIKLRSINAQASIHGLTLGKNSELNQLHLAINHLMPNCTSNTVMRGIFNDQSTGNFTGKIIVAPIASNTTANLEIKNLILSDKARAIACPELEIYNDEVKCTHGATIGHLDEQALFYCQSRGIPELEAKNLLVQSFASPALKAIEDKGILDRIELFLRKLMDKTHV